MRGVSLGAMAVSAALVAAAPAHARDRDYAGTLSVSGRVTVSWHGDPARGCAAAGLCGYAGAVTLRPDDGDYDFVVNGRGRLSEGIGDLYAFLHSPVVRVRRTDGGGDEGGCVDTTSGSSFELTPSRAGGRRVRVGLVGVGLSSGRCAGPSLAGVVTRLPRRTRTISDLTRGGAQLDFSRTFSYSVGRFSGTVRSTLRIRLERSTPDTSFAPGYAPPHPRRLKRVVHVRAVYRVSDFTGSLTTQFTGLTDAPCADFDACGVSGSSRWAVAGRRGTFVVEGDALARRRDRGLRGALRAIRRRGAYVNGDAELYRNFGTTTADVSRAGGAPCHDTAGVASPGLFAFRSGNRFVLELGGEEADPASGDLLRAGCPGPRDADAIGSSPAATGSIPVTAIGRRLLQVRLRRSKSFAGRAYSGSSAADFALGLRRVSLQFAYRRARGIG